MQLKPYALILVFVLISFASQPLSGSEIVWRSVGARAGMDDNRGDEDFNQYEGFTTWQLPWSWQWKSGWALNTYLEVTAGVNYFYEKAINGDGACRNQWVSDPNNIAIRADANGIPILQLSDGDRILWPAADTVTDPNVDTLPEDAVNANFLDGPREMLSAEESS